MMLRNKFTGIFVYNSGNYNNIKVCCTFLIFIFLLSCQNSNTDKQLFHKISGKTMGTYYVVSYFSTEPTIEKKVIENKLEEINQELSTYIPTSTISLFNESKDRFTTLNRPNSLNGSMFEEVFDQAKDIHKLSNGFFDPTIMPLVNYWGFGYTPRSDSMIVDSLYITKLLSYVGFEKINKIKTQSKRTYIKSISEVQLDFSAIAKGYGVDLIGYLLEHHGINNYLIDIGGEVLASGVKPLGKKWTLGINKPMENADYTNIVKKVVLRDKAMASSGNYRNFYTKNGIKYSHTINPHTGYTERNNLLSTSIIADNCMIADAYATACMVMGYPHASLMIENIDGVEALFILNEDGKLIYRHSSGWDDIQM